MCGHSSNSEEDSFGSYFVGTNEDWDLTNSGSWLESWDTTFSSVIRPSGMVDSTPDNIWNTMACDSKQNVCNTTRIWMTNQRSVSQWSIALPSWRCFCCSWRHYNKKIFFAMTKQHIEVISSLLYTVHILKTKFMNLLKQWTHNVANFTFILS